MGIYSRRILVPPYIMLLADQPVPLTCPACGAVLLLYPPSSTFRCRLGHEYLPEQLAISSDKNLKRTLWACLRQLEEQQWLHTQIAARTEANEPMPDLHPVMQQLRQWLKEGLATEQE